MKLIIAGSRHLTVTVDELRQALDNVKINGQDLTEIVSGGCKGIDLCGEAYARYKGLPIKRFIPYWDLYGKAAGPMRNYEMAEYADSLFLIWDGKSRGSKNILDRMTGLRKTVIQIVKDRS